VGCTSSKMQFSPFFRFYSIFNVTSNLNNATKKINVSLYHHLVYLLMLVHIQFTIQTKKSLLIFFSLLQLDNTLILLNMYKNRKDQPSCFFFINFQHVYKMVPFFIFFLYLALNGEGAFIKGYTRDE
jgi:hypothetical protein